MFQPDCFNSKNKLLEIGFNFAYDYIDGVKNVGLIFKQNL